MAKYRIYPIKSNTLIENTQINTGQNEVMELWYGRSGATRHLVQFDYSDYMTKYNQGLVPHITAATTTFVMYNVPEILEGSGNWGAVHASSVDIEVKVVQQSWDEGIGRDFIGLNKVSGFSNWYSATTTSNWAAPGGDFLYTAFSGHIDNSYDNFTGSVSSEIALWETFTGQNYGLAVVYSDAIEALTGATKSILKFHTEDTKTWKLPYIEIDWDNQITDQRDEIVPGTTKRLYLYTETNNVLTNANSVSSATVTVSGSSATTITTINNPMPGIYYVEYPCWSGYSSGETFEDVWSVQYEDGTAFVDVSQSGTLVSAQSLWDNSAFDSIDRDYTLSIPRMKREYNRDSYIFIGVNLMRKYTSTPIISKTLEYRLTLVDGNNRETIINWEGVSYTQNSNFILLDTSWLLRNMKYELTFRHTIDGSIMYFEDERQFKVI